MEQTPAAAASPGRPRSEQARRAVLDAALSLVRRDGYQAVTIKAVAEQAGVGRQTVYRWWTSKAAILLEAVTELARDVATPPLTGDTEHDLRALLRTSFALSDTAGPVISHLMADATHDPEIHELLQRVLLEPRRRLVASILEEGQRVGRLGHAAPLELAVDMVWGTMWYRILSRHAPVDARFADQLTDAVLTMLGRVESKGADV